jgi:hypothetical protein
MDFKTYVAMALLLAAGCVAVDTKETTATFIHPLNDSLDYDGRMKKERDSCAVYWPGSGVTFRFKGTSVRALIRDEFGKNYFNVILDRDSLRYFKPDSTRSWQILAANLKDTVHTVSLLKRTETGNGNTWLFGFDMKGELLPPPPTNGRTIEFFGNSITAGYAIEDYTGGDSPDSIFSNNYYTYAAITARHFNADYYCTSRSGIGILVSWFPMIMPEMYDRLDPSDSSSKWDFAKVKPDVVVINLFQNDSWLVKMPDHPSFRERFGKKPPSDKQIIAAYLSFLSSIRGKYPEAYIICALGSMDATKEGSAWPSYINEAVKQASDNKVFSHFFPYMNKGGHPRKEDNELMAESLISFIENNIPRWQK